MNAEETLILQGLKIEIETLALAVGKLTGTVKADRPQLEIPEWVTLERAVSLKGGAALASYQTKLWLQPCCGRNFKLVGGRKCWSRDEIIRWLSITDSNLKDYAAEWKVKIPENYERRSA